MPRYSSHNFIFVTLTWIIGVFLLTLRKLNRTISKTPIVWIAMVATCSSLTAAKETKNTKEMEEIMIANGTFEVNLEPQKDEVAPAGRMIINKKYSGGLDGTGIGQMISKRIDNGAAVYFAIEEFEGSLNRKTGSFTLIHSGYMSGETRSLKIKIQEGSGSGELSGISGTLKIIQEGDTHKYDLAYEF